MNPLNPILVGSSTLKDTAFTSMLYSDDTDSSPNEHMKSNSFRVQIIELEKMKRTLEKRIRSIDMEIYSLESKYTGRNSRQHMSTRRPTLRLSVDDHYHVPRKTSRFSVESPTMLVACYKNHADVSTQTQFVPVCKATMWSRVKKVFHL